MQQKNKTAFFIVTPSFNQAQFIRQTIDSVLRQSGDFVIEYFVADGGSSDTTKEILKSFASKLSFVSEKDAGQTDAINKGIAHFTSLQANYREIYFAYINSDDFYAPGAFSLVAKYFQSHPAASWLAGDAKIIDAQGKEIQTVIRAYKQLLRKLFFLQLLYILNPIPQPAVFFRWEAIRSLGSFDNSLQYTMDYEYWLRAQQKLGKPIFLAKTLAAFRIHRESKGGSSFEGQFAEELQVAKRYTTNSVLLALHSLHNAVILFIYRIIK